MFKQDPPPNEQGVLTKGRRGRIDVLILFVPNSLQQGQCVIKLGKIERKDDIILS